MESLQQQLAQLTPEQVKQLLGASGHAQLLQTQQESTGTQAPPLSESALSQVEQAKQRGNECFRNKEFALAVEAYSTAIDLDPRNAVCLSNRAAAYLKLQDFRSAIEDCTRAIDITSTIKSLMRRAVARIEFGEFGEAVEDLTAALSFEPQNKECIAKLSKIASMQPISGGPSTTVDRSTRIKAALAVGFSRDGWRSIAVKGNPAPPALNGHTLFRSAEGKVYLFGGRSVRDQKTQVYALDNRDFSWDVVSMTGSAPSPRAWHSISCIDNATSTMCVYGGVSSQGEDPHIYFISFESDGRLNWVQPQSIEGESPSPRSGHSAAAISRSSATTSDTFIFGGRTKSGVSESMYILRSSKTEDVCGDQGFKCVWEEAVWQAGPWPAPRDGHTMCALSTISEDGATSVKLVLFGGNGQRNEEKMNDTWLFDTESCRWQEMKCTGDIPAPRSYHTAHVVGSCMFVVGGRMRDAEDSGMYMLDTVSQEWFRVPIPEQARLSARAWHSSILTDERKLFLLGGGTFTGPKKDAALLDLSKFAALVTK